MICIQLGQTLSDWRDTEDVDRKQRKTESYMLISNKEIQT